MKKDTDKTLDECFESIKKKIEQIDKEHERYMAKILIIVVAASAFNISAYFLTN